MQRPSESVSEPLLLRGELVGEAEAEYQAEFGANACRCGVSASRAELVVRLARQVGKPVTRVP